jgi:hypothetical protein
MNDSNEPALSEPERRQLVDTLAALALTGCGVVGLTLASRRFPILRKWLQSSRWRMRTAIAAFSLSYNLISHLHGEGKDTAEQAPPPGE